MPIDLLDPRYGPTVTPKEFFARRHERDPALREAYLEIARHRRAEIDRHGYEPDAPGDAREAAARHVAAGAYRAYLRHDPGTGDAVDLGDGATLIIGRGGANGRPPPGRYWGLLAGLVGLGVLQVLAATLSRGSEEPTEDTGDGEETRR